MERRVFSIQGVLVLRNLCGHIAHEVHAACNVIAEVLFSPCLGTANNHHALFKGLGGSGGNVGFTVIVHRIPIQKATHGKTGIAGAILAGEHRPNIRFPASARDFFRAFRVRLGTRPTMYLNASGLKDFASNLLLAIVQTSFLCSQIVWVTPKPHPGFPPCTCTVRHRTFWKGHPRWADCGDRSFQRLWLP